jgi:hypothetical protein
MSRTSKKSRCSVGRIMVLVLALAVRLFAQEQSAPAIWRGFVINSAGIPTVGAKVRLKELPPLNQPRRSMGAFSCCLELGRTVALNE